MRVLGENCESKLVFGDFVLTYKAHANLLTQTNVIGLQRSTR